MARALGQRFFEKFSIGDGYVRALRMQVSDD